MNRVPLAVAQADCWNRIGFRGDRSCPELASVIHCHNCPVFADAGRQFLDAPSPEGYLEEWTERLAAPLEEEDADRLSVLIFRLGEEWLALPVGVLVEVSAARTIHRVPHRGGLLRGLVNIRGELHLCVRLQRVLGIETAASPAPRERGGQARFLVVEREGERWVFPVDEVDQVYRFPAQHLRPVPVTLGRAPAHLTRGVFDASERAVGLLEDDRLFQVLRESIR
jgi:chemotaxis-related protein WspD